MKLACLVLIFVLIGESPVAKSSPIDGSDDVAPKFQNEEPTYPPTEPPAEHLIEDPTEGPTEGPTEAPTEPPTEPSTEPTTTPG